MAHFGEGMDRDPMNYIKEASKIYRLRLGCPSQITQSLLDPTVAIDI